MGLYFLNSLQNKKAQRHTFGPLMALLTVIFVGCAANRENLVKSGRVTLQKQATGKVDIAWCDAYEDDNGLLMTGVVRRRDAVGTPIKDRADVAVISPDGRTLDEACSSVISVHRRRVGRLHQSLKRVTVRFPKVPPRGSSVSVVTKSGIT
jgi:hypothetical protein